MKVKFRATSEFRRDGEGRSPRANVPGEVRQFLGAAIGDRLLFEEGSTFAADRAAIVSRGRYLVVYLDPSARPSPAAQRAEAPAPAMESLEETISRLRAGPH